MSWAGRAVAEALAELGPTVVVPEDLSWRAAGVSIDSRTLQAGELFVALSGPRYDGAAFLPQAAEAGAVAASPPPPLPLLSLPPFLPLLLHLLLPRACSCARLCARPAPASAPAQRRSSLPLFEVPDSLEGLTALARYARDASRARRAAITASSGKTTLRELLQRALGGGLPGALVHASEKSHNNLVGVSLTLARLPEEAAFAVLELGTNNPGEIADLAELARPDLALLGAIGTAHIGRFAGEDALAAEKAAILCGWEGGGPSLAVVEESALARPQVREALAASGAEAHIYGAGAGAGAGAGTGADTGTSTSASGTAGSAGLGGPPASWIGRPPANAQGLSLSGAKGRRRCSGKGAAPPCHPCRAPRRQRTRRASRRPPSRRFAGGGRRGAGRLPPGSGAGGSAARKLRGRAAVDHGRRLQREPGVHARRSRPAGARPSAGRRAPPRLARRDERAGSGERGPPRRAWTGGGGGGAGSTLPRRAADPALKDALTRRAPSLPVFHEDEPAAIARRLQDFLAPHDVLLIKASRAAALEEVAALLVRDTHSDSATDAPGTPAAPGASSPEAA